MEPTYKTFDRRVVAIDLVRGLIMVLMALDHTRDFFSRAGFDPLDLQKTHAALFLTRWVTHYCAPLFIFLSGTSAFLSLDRNGNRASQSRLLLTRGLLLIVLELTLVRWTGWNFGLEMHRVTAGVLWAIGWSMICLSALLQLRLQVIGLVGLIMMAGHNLLDGLRPEQFGGFGWLWQILHARGAFDFGPGLRFNAYYPLIPWIGVMAPVLLSARYSFRIRPHDASCYYAGGWPDSGVHRAAPGKSLRRCGAMVDAAVGPLHPPVLPKMHEVSTFAALPPDDPGAGTAPSWRSWTAPFPGGCSRSMCSARSPCFSTFSIYP